PYTIPILTGIHGVGVVLFPVVQSRCLWRVCLSIMPQLVFPYLVSKRGNSNLNGLCVVQTVLSFIPVHRPFIDWVFQNFEGLLLRHAHGWASFPSSISILGRNT